MTQFSDNVENPDSLFFRYPDLWSNPLQRRIWNAATQLLLSFFAKAVGFQPLNIVSKKLHHRCLKGLYIRFCLLALAITLESEMELTLNMDQRLRHYVRLSRRFDFFYFTGFRILWIPDSRRICHNLLNCIFSNVLSK